MSHLLRAAAVTVTNTWPATWQAIWGSWTAKTTQLQPTLTSTPPATLDGTPPTTLEATDV